MCYAYSMLDNTIEQREIKRQPIDDYEMPKMLNRFGAAALDLALFVLLSFIVLTISGLIAGQKGSKMANANTLIEEQIKYSKLAKYEEKNGYVSYNNDDLLTIEENEPLIVNRLVYFYCSYLTGENIETGYEASLNKDEEIKIDGNSVLPKNYYNVRFINEKVLKMKDEKQEIKYFKYQENEGQIDESKIALIDPQYVEEVISNNQTIKRLKNDSGLMNFLNAIYQDGIKVFYSQKAVSSANKTINKINTILMFVSTIPSFIVFYLIVPLCSPFGKTIGKHILSIAVVSDRGYLIKKWQTLLRGVPILGATIYVCLINSLYYQLLLPLLLLLISMGILVFTPRRRALHDLVAATTVIKSDKRVIVYPDEDHYEQALAIMKERDQAING